VTPRVHAGILSKVKVFLINDDKLPPGVLSDWFLREGDGVVVLDMPVPFSEGLSLLRQATQRVLGHAAGLTDPPSDRWTGVETDRNARKLDGGPSLHLNESQWLATMNGKPLNLTRCEFRLLQALARHPGRIYTRGHLLQFAYDQPESANERAVDSHIKNLRRKLAEIAPKHKWIRSTYGIGFSFEERR